MTKHTMIPYLRHDMAATVQWFPPRALRSGDVILVGERPRTFDNAISAVEFAAALEKAGALVVTIFLDDGRALSVAAATALLPD